MSILQRFSWPRSRPLVVHPGEDDNLRHATWLELFLDLVFVLAVAELGGYLHANLTVGGLLRFAVLFVIVWWIWLNISYFSDSYDTDDLTSHLMMILAMFGASSYRVPSTVRSTAVRSRLPRVCYCYASF